MKKIFTLIAAVFAAVAVNAADWTPKGSTPGANEVLVDDDLVTFSTVFAGTNGTIMDETDNPTTITYGGKTFKTYMQIRVNAAPSASDPTGTEQSGSTPLVIVAKKDIKLTYYYRRQAVTDAGYTDNDGKDMKIVDQAAPATAIAGSEFYVDNPEDAYGQTYKTVYLSAGKTYTLWARGTTGRLYGISYEEGTAGGGEVDPGTAGGDIPAGWGDVYTWEGGADGAVEVGGTAVASDGESVNYANADYYTMRINKKKADIDTENIQITFNEALKAGDKIAITGYRNKDTDANGTLYMLFSNGASIDEGDAVVWNNIHSAIGQQPNTNVYDVTDAIAGSTSVKIARSTASTNVFIIKVRVARSGGSSVLGVQAADEAAPAVKKIFKNGNIVLVNGADEFSVAGAQLK